MGMNDILNIRGLAGNENTYLYFVRLGYIKEINDDDISAIIDNMGILELRTFNKLMFEDMDNIDIGMQFIIKISWPQNGALIEFSDKFDQFDYSNFTDDDIQLMREYKLKWIIETT